MSGVTMKFKGMNSYIAGVEGKSKAIQKEVGNAIYESAQRVAKEAQKNAPVDTGHLKQNIVASRLSAMTARIDSFANYSWYVEKGTRKMDPQPFLQPAINNESVRIYLICQSIVQNGVL
jgi:HK97 gp10 family phage protein